MTINGGDRGERLTGQTFSLLDDTDGNGYCKSVVLREDRFDGGYVWLPFGSVKKNTERAATEKPDSRYSTNPLVAMGVLALTSRLLFWFSLEPKYTIICRRESEWERERETCFVVQSLRPHMRSIGIRWADMYASKRFPKKTNISWNVAKPDWWSPGPNPKPPVYRWPVFPGKNNYKDSEVKGWRPVQRNEENMSKFLSYAIWIEYVAGYKCQ